MDAAGAAAAIRDRRRRFRRRPQRFAGWAAILAAPTAVAGICGMNFEHMPELARRCGDFAALALIFGAAGTRFALVPRSGRL